MTTSIPPTTPAAIPPLTFGINLEGREIEVHAHFIPSLYLESPPVESPQLEPAPLITSGSSNSTGLSPAAAAAMTPSLPLPILNTLYIHDSGQFNHPYTPTRPQLDAICEAARFRLTGLPTIQGG